MRRLLEFIRSTYVFLIFVALEAAALNHYAHSSVYARAKILTRAARVTGAVNGGLNEVKHYFSLGRENDQLLTRVAELENRIALYEASGATVADVAGPADEAVDPLLAKYSYMSASVVSLSVNKLNNFVIVDKGMDDGVRTSMAVVSPSGSMVGYVVGCSGRYSAVMPVINTSFRASGMLRGDNNYSSVEWDGRGTRHARLLNLLKYANPEVGDTIVSTGHSNIFPQGIVIGRIARMELNELQTAYNIDIELATDFSALHRVVIIDNRDFDEIQELLLQAEDPNR